MVRKLLIAGAAASLIAGPIAARETASNDIAPCTGCTILTMASASGADGHKHAPGGRGDEPASRKGRKLLELVPIGHEVSHTAEAV